MNQIVLAMLLVFVSMLPWTFVRASLQPRQQRFLNRMQRGFMYSCLILFAPLDTKSDVFAAIIGITVVAYLLGVLASAGLLWLLSWGKMPNPRIEPAVNEDVSALVYDWGRDAIIYKVKMVWVPYCCGLLVASVAYWAFA